MNNSRFLAVTAWMVSFALVVPVPSAQANSASAKKLGDVFNPAARGGNGAGSGGYGGSSGGSSASGYSGGSLPPGTMHSNHSGGQIVQHGNGSLTHTVNGVTNTYHPPVRTDSPLTSDWQAVKAQRERDLAEQAERTRLQRQADNEKLAQERRLADEKRQQERALEQQRAEEKARQEQRIAEEKRLADERLAAEKRQQEQAALAKRQADEKAAQEAKAAEQRRLNDERLAEQKRVEDAARRDKAIEQQQTLAAKVPVDSNPLTADWKSIRAQQDTKRFSSEKQALVDMAQADKRKGITQADMQAYKDLNKTLPDPFPTGKKGNLRGPEQSIRDGAGPHSKAWHGRVGPVNHIPITDMK